jgi:hypothetical protein
LDRDMRSGVRTDAPACSRASVREQDACCSCSTIWRAVLGQQPCYRSLYVYSTRAPGAQGEKSRFRHLDRHLHAHSPGGRRSSPSRRCDETFISRRDARTLLVGTRNEDRKGGPSHRRLPRSDPASRLHPGYGHGLRPMYNRTDPRAREPRKVDDLGRDPQLRGISALEGISLRPDHSSAVP